MLTADMKPYPKTPPTPPSYSLVESGQCDYPVTTLEQCIEGATALDLDVSTMRTQDESKTCATCAASHCGMAYDGAAGAYYLNFDPAGGNTGECKTNTYCVCLDKPPAATTTDGAGAGRDGKYAPPVCAQICVPVSCLGERE